MNYRETIRKYFTDDEGNYILGVDEGITPEKLLKACNLPFDQETAEGRERINRARIELNAFMTKLLFEGYCGGSTGRSPTIYFIARNKAERKMMLAKTAKNLIGRLHNAMIRGKGLIPELPIKRTQKMLSPFIPQEK